MPSLHRGQREEREDKQQIKSNSHWRWVERLRGEATGMKSKEGYEGEDGHGRGSVWEGGSGRKTSWCEVPTHMSTFYWTSPFWPGHWTHIRISRGSSIQLGSLSIKIFSSMATVMSFLPSSIPKFPPHPALTATSRPLAVPSSDRKMRVPYELRRGQNRLFHELPSGLSMEFIEQKGAETEGITGDPPLVFVHGSYHAAWCWAEHWLPFFSSRGFDCYALSLLGQVIRIRFLSEKISYCRWK